MTARANRRASRWKSQQLAIDLEEMRENPPLAVEPPHATAGSEIGDQELAIAHHRDAIWQETRRSADDVPHRLADFHGTGNCGPPQKARLWQWCARSGRFRTSPIQVTAAKRDQRCFGHGAILRWLSKQTPRLDRRSRSTMQRLCLRRGRGHAAQCSRGKAHCIVVQTLVGQGDGPRRRM
jgi:hypothetical protein